MKLCIPGARLLRNCAVFGLAPYRSSYRVLSYQHFLCEAPVCGSFTFSTSSSALYSKFLRKTPRFSLMSGEKEVAPQGVEISPEVAPLPPDDLACDDYQLSSRHQPLFGREDRYDGIIVDPSSLPADETKFQEQLQDSLALWQAQGKHGIWLKLPLANAKLVPIAIEAGFAYHHAEDTHVMLTRWLPSTPSTLPPNASHQVGIGAFVLNGQRQVLAIQERNGPLRGLGVWKMPTGLVNEAEDVCAGAVREVKEETGVDTEFLEVVAIRQAHQMAFGKSDLFFLCALRPLSSEIKRQETEIEDAKWMDLEEFGAQPFYADRALRQMLNLCISHANGSYRGYKAEHYDSNHSNRPPSVLYWNQSDTSL